MNLTKIAIASLVSLGVVGIGIKPASAVNFTISGTLSNGGTFSGTYSLDDVLASLPIDGIGDVGLTSFSVNVFDSSNTEIYRFSPQNAQGSITNVRGNFSAITFFSEYDEIHILDISYEGTIPTPQQLGQPGYNSFFETGSEYESDTGGAFVTNAQINPVAPQSVPDPFTVDGIAVFASIGFFMKKKSSTA